MKVLEIDCSVREAGSVSRQLTAEFIARLKGRYPDLDHHTRDVGLNPPQHPTAAFMWANYTPPNERTAEMESVLAASDELIEELAAADGIVLGCPIYNFTVPSSFKAYVDSIVRTGRTFAFDPQTFTFSPLLSGQKAVVISPSAGNYAPGTPAAASDFCTPYVRSILAFIGITDVEIINVPDQFMPEEIRLKSMDAARNRLLEVAATW